jgi:hypothetical protein
MHTGQQLVPVKFLAALVLFDDKKAGRLQPFVGSEARTAL